MVKVMLSISVVLLVGCVWMLSPHQNFIDTFNYQVGKNFDDPSVYKPRRRVKSSTLSSGLLEIEYQHLVRWGGCRVFYEVDPVSRKIVNWRFEGTEEACYINP